MVRSSERRSVMGSSSTQVLSTRKLVLTAVAVVTMAGFSVALTDAARAATPLCAGDCISVFSSELGTPTQPNFVEAVLAGGAANVGQPVGLKAASRFEPSEDIQP